MSSIIKCFVYNVSTQDEKVSKLIDKFIKDNGLTQVFIHHQLDLQHPESMFSKSSLSERDMMDQLHRAFLNLAFNRFSWLMAKDQPVKKVRAKREIKLVEPQKISIKYYDDEIDVHIVSTLTDSYCLCGNSIDRDRNAAINMKLLGSSILQNRVVPVME